MQKNTENLGKFKKMLKNSENTVKFRKYSKIQKNAEKFRIDSCCVNSFGALPTKMSQKKCRNAHLIAKNGGKKCKKITKNAILKITTILHFCWVGQVMLQLFRMSLLN
jgi:hypothetical protein